ncbi:hypothetical protein AQUCO_02800301v1 [Aquilegia coerulea]|uniref:Cytochrome P450 n=1 Tax=Aquilegia coerulea TaxID=218851 RepID=A0A2G5D4Q9_AQUCA|nr:hypothetical protein AQUCO_02800301v1 [Aquilegia coerulea]
MFYQYPFLFTLLISFFTLISLKLIITGSFSEKLNLPPSPPKLPIIGNLHQLGQLLHRSLHKLSLKYGPLMYLRLGYTPVLVVSSAELIREIKTTHEISFGNRPATTAARMLFYGCVDLVFSPCGEYWRQIRKISASEMMSNKKVHSFKSVRDEEVALLTKKISTSCSVGTSVNISELVTDIVYDIMCRCALGRKLGAQDGHLKEISPNLVKLLVAFSFGDLFPWLGWMDVLTGLIGRIKKVSKELDIFFDHIIDEHLIQNKEGGPDGYNNDFVDTLLQVQMDNINFTRNNIKAIILDLFVGGTETTSSVIEWVMAELMMNPHTMQKAQEEVRRVVGKNNKVEEEDIQHMYYLKLVVMESLRLHPPVALLPMETTTITNVNSYHVPAKTNVVVNIWAIHRDPNLWERPEEFIPERFSNSPIGFNGQDFKYIPFGSGRRMCGGILFSTILLELVIANLLYWFDWRTLGDAELDMTEDYGLTVSKKLPIHLLPVSHFPSTVKTDSLKY